MSEIKSPSKLDEVIDGLVTTLNETKSFVLEQAPDVAKQMVAERQVEIKYQTISNLFIWITALAVALTSLLYNDARDDLVIAVRAILGVMAAISLLPATCAVIENLKDAAQLKAAPKVFLLNKLKRLVG